MAFFDPLLPSLLIGLKQLTDENKIRGMNAEGWVAICTGILALATFGLAVTTVRLELTWKKSMAQQLGLQTWLTLQARFDTKEMKDCRSKLAHQLSNYTSSIHGEVVEDLFDLFEDVAAIKDLGLLNTELAESTFSFYVNHWWRASKPYVDRERMIHGDDKSLFAGFEKLAAAWQHLDPEINDDKLKRFLDDEKSLSAS